MVYMQNKGLRFHNQQKRKIDLVTIQPWRDSMGVMIKHQV